MRVEHLLYQKAKLPKIYIIVSKGHKATRTGQRWGREIKYKSNNNYSESKYIIHVQIHAFGRNGEQLLKGYRVFF